MTNRDDPLFQGTTTTNTLNLGLTTHCTMKCPECHVKINKHREEGTARHANINDIIRDAKHMTGLRRVHLCGGEPSMHPEFATIVRNVQRWFGNELLTIETNGHYYMKYRDLFKNCFDRVFITHYEKDKVYPGAPDNTSIIYQASLDLSYKLIKEPAVEHLPLVPLGVIKHDVPCTKWYSPGLPCAWYNGLLYACCTTFGIDESLGIPVTANWKKEIIMQDKGCHSCVFQGT